jgi:uncharacterized delta-60 repeat protein
MVTLWQRRRPASGRQYRPFMELLEERALLSPTSLDATFGSGGATAIPFGTSLSGANAVALQSDGKIVVVGSVETSAPNFNDFAVARLNADGSLDATFGSGGKATIPFNLGGHNDDTASGVALQSDGKIVVVGTVDTGAPGGRDMAVARLNADGTLDAGFGTGGKTTIPFDLGGSNNDDANGVAIQSDGKIVVVGDADTGAPGGSDFAAARLSPNGSLDATFGTGGKTTVPFNLGGSNIDYANAVVLQSDGKIVLAGGAANGSSGSDFAAARLNPNGSLDATFGTGGKTTVAVSPSDLERVQAMALQSDGKIVLAGTNDLNPFEIVRLSAAGALDTGFGTAGKATATFGHNVTDVGGVAIQSNGRILVSGSSVDDLGGTSAIVRLFADGSPDTSFGGNQGAVAFNFGAGGRQATGVMALQSNGKIVLAGFTPLAGVGNSFAVVRLLGGQTVESPPPVPIQVPAPPAATGVKVLHSGKTGQVTGFLVSFNEALDPASAQDPTHYALLIPVKGKGKVKKHKPLSVAIVKAVYDAAANTVTLFPGKFKSTARTGLLEVIGVADPSGDVLQGTAVFTVDLRPLPKHPHLGKG